ncbi:MAG: NUDIX domain-containing protein [Leptolyngbya sp. SIO1E4]|nr:NUDIX domain-containing protein [Leptolyngbya sp. SIO1E4]
MSEAKALFQTHWVSLKATERGFHYLERKGRDSVAVFLMRTCRADAQGYEVLIRQQPLCIDNSEANGSLKLFPCPITGGIDGDETPEAAAVREVNEEAGYTVQVTSLGRYIVGTQTNEICYLFYADVTGQVPGIAEQDGSYFESISRNEWHPFDYLATCEYAACQIRYYRLRHIALFS